MAKDKYEISLWDDVFVAASGNVSGHYEEEKIAIIGSDTMTTQCRAIEPKLVCNVNGKVTFTFKMYYRYHDELTGEDYDNPFLKLLINERKVKVYWNKQWYDLIIKNIQESSNGRTVVYSCEDANINELAKTGFDLIFDDDISVNNVEDGNYGTVEELVQKVINGTDWRLGEHETIQQFTEEAVYEVDLTRGIGAYNMTAGTSTTIPSMAAEGIPTKILVFYPQLTNFVNTTTTSDVAVSTTIDHFYFAYDPEQRYDRYAKTEMLVQADCYSFYFEGDKPVKCEVENDTMSFMNATNSSVFGSVGVTSISSKYRANRLVKAPLIKIEPITKTSCYIYTATAAPTTGAYVGKISAGETVYKTIGSEFEDALYATNLLVNGIDFTSLDGWEYTSTYPLNLTVYPATGDTSKVYIATASNSSDSVCYYYNDAIRANSQFFKDGCVQGEQYRFRIKAKNSGKTTYCSASSLYLYPFVGEWNNNSGPRQPDGENRYFTVASATDESDNWIHFDMTCKESFSGADIYSKHIGLFIGQYAHVSTRYIEEIQFFKIVKDSDGNVILPGALDKTGIVNTVYTYFTVDTVLGEVKNYLYKGVEDWNFISSGVSLEQQYNDNYAKVRSISAKQSNRFNILQTIAETFECWIRFYVPHNENGSLIYKDDNNNNTNIPRKFVTIKQDMGVERGIGFVYGIDLQSIQRTIESNQIVTKTIVLENNNSAGKNGTCRISRSPSNYPQTDYILNFDYYINHGLLDGTELNKDLYTRSGSWDSGNSRPADTRAFYYQLHKWNSEYEQYAELNAGYQIAVNKSEGYKTAYETALSAIYAEIKKLKEDVLHKSHTSAYDNQSTQNYINEHINNDNDLKATVEALRAQEQLKIYYQEQIRLLKSAITSYNNKIKNNQTNMDNRTRWIKYKNELFNRKYARFISEGSWIDQKYFDDNLYYLDANSVAYTSSRPKVSYNISVIRVTGIEGFEIKDFALGDITYIEDTDFFGYVYLDDGTHHNVKTPYREKVVVTEVTYNFDEPDKDTFKVQNYRTQFEDLFQRIAAQTQSLQYSTGAYAKVSDIIKSDGTIKSSILQQSMLANEEALNRSSLNNSVVTNEQGITVSNLLNASEAVRITSGGLFITTDGGDNWNNAIHGDGIGTQFLTSGVIHTNKIQIFGDEGTDENAVAFKWDAQGLNAYDKTSQYVVSNTDYAYDPLRFVRLNGTGVTIQEATGVLTDTSRATYEKLKLGQIGTTGTGSNMRNVYGLKINSYVNGAVETALAATDTGLFVNGDITAKSLTLTEGVSISASKVSCEGASLTTKMAEFSTSIDSLHSEISSIETSAINLLPSVYATEYTKSQSAGTSCQINGIYWTLNSDGSVTAKGTATSSAYYALAGTATSSPIPPILLDSTKKYTLSGCASGGSSSKYWLQASLFTASSTPSSTGANTTKYDYGSAAGVSIPSGYRWANIYAVIAAGATVNNVTFYPMFEGGNVAHSYVSTHGGSGALMNKVITNSTNISQTSTDITLQASRIETIEGTQNLLRNSSTFKDWIQNGSSSGSPFISTATGFYYVGFPAAESASSRYVKLSPGLRIPYASVRNKYIAVSVYAQSNDYASITGGSNNRLRVLLGLYTHGEDTLLKYKYLTEISNNSTPALNADSNNRFFWKEKITDSWFNSGTGTISVNDDFSITLYDNSIYRATFQRPQIEIITKEDYENDDYEPSPYTPNLLDVNLSSTEASIKVNANNIALKVSRTDLTNDTTSSSIVIDPEHISLKGKTIDLTSDTINIASTNFSVSSAGVISAKSGNIAGWTISSTNLQKVATPTNDSYKYRVLLNSPTSPSASNNAIQVSKTNVAEPTTGDWTAGVQFSVTYGGKMTAKNADIEGKITATSGTIGGLTIENKFFHNGSSAATATDSDSTNLVLSGGQEFTRNINGTLRQHLRFALGDGFGVSTGGRLYASNVIISGDITATSGSFTGNITANSLKLNEGVTVPAARISGQLTAGQINGTGLTITGSGTIGPFTVGTEGNYPTLSCTGMKLNSLGLFTANAYITQLGGYGTADGAENITLVLSNGTTATLYSYIRAVANLLINERRKTAVYTRGGSQLHDGPGTGTYEAEGYTVS